MGHGSQTGINSGSIAEASEGSGLWVWQFLFMLEYLRSTFSPGLFPRAYPGQENYERSLFSSIFMMNFHLLFFLFAHV